MPSQEDFGNPSSVHHFGQQAKALLDESRSAVADLIGAEPAEVVFTSGGTEADNLALRGAAEILEAAGRRHLVTSSIEHEAVLNTVKALTRRGWSATLLPVDASGIVSPAALDAAITDETAVVSVMHANNEIGTIQPIAELAAIAHAARRAVPHRRGAVGREDSGGRPSARHRSAVALGAQVQRTQGGRRALDQARHRHGRDDDRRQARTEPARGHRERARARRPGRGRAARRGRSWRPRRHASRRSATAWSRGSCAGCPARSSTARSPPRVPNTTNISFDGVEAESLLIALDLEGFAVSTGSACSSGTLEPSHVLRAMGLPSHRTQNSIRFSLGAGNTDAEVDALLAKLPATVEKLRIAGQEMK